MSDAPRAGLTRFVARDGHRLSYEAHGAKGGPALLGWHDLLAGRAQLRPLAVTLAADGVHVVLPDTRGHGASPTISGRAFPTAELVNDALTVLDAEAMASVVVVAAGWCAAAALALAAGAPERVAALVLIEPYLPPLLAAYADGAAREAGETQCAVLEAARNAGERGQLDHALDLVFGARMGDRWRDRLPRARQAAARRNAVNLAPLLAGFLSDPLAADDLKRLQLPVTITRREDSPPVICLTAISLGAMLPRATIAVLESSGEDAYSPGSPLREIVLAAANPDS